MTCCDTRWNISLTERELFDYQCLNHPFRQTILDAIDMEKRRIKADVKHKCLLLTAEGWCRIVQECGDTCLPLTCRMFPRQMYRFGDIVERTVGIACPVAAGYLFEEKIGFDWSEEEVGGVPARIDDSLYDSLSWMRTFLIELIQSYDQQYGAGKVYVVLDAVHKLRQEIEKIGTVRKETMERICQSYEEMPETVLEQLGMCAENYAAKAVIVQKYLHDLWQEAGRILLKGFGAEDDTLQGNLELWLMDSKLLAEDIQQFIAYCRFNYGRFLDNFLVYSLFDNFISIDLHTFGNDVITRCLELFLIQIGAISLFKRDGKIKTKDYEKLISGIDRKLFHTNHKELLYQMLKEKNLECIEKLIMITIG